MTSYTSSLLSPLQEAGSRDESPRAACRFSFRPRTPHSPTARPGQLPVLHQRRSRDKCASAARGRALGALARLPRPAARLARRLSILHGPRLSGPAGKARASLPSQERWMWLPTASRPCSQTMALPGRRHSTKPAGGALASLGRRQARRPHGRSCRSCCRSAPARSARQSTPGAPHVGRQHDRHRSPSSAFTCRYERIARGCLRV